MPTDSPVYDTGITRHLTMTMQFLFWWWSMEEGIRSRRLQSDRMRSAEGSGCAWSHADASGRVHERWTMVTSWRRTMHEPMTVAESFVCSWEWMTLDQKRKLLEGVIFGLTWKAWFSTRLERHYSRLRPDGLKRKCSIQQRLSHKNIRVPFASKNDHALFTQKSTKESRSITLPYLFVVPNDSAVRS